MLKVSSCALILCATGFAVVSAEPVVNLEISAGAVIQTDSPVKFASLGEPIVGSGSGGFAGAGFSYTINLFKFSGTPRSATAILWNWIKIPRAGSYQVFNSAGNPVSDILPTGAVSFLQTNAAPDSVVSGFVRAYNDTGYIDSPPFTVTTLPKNPRMLELFSNQQVADFVVGSDQVGTEANRLKAPENIRYDRFGNLWVADTYNSRVLRFSPPFTTDKSADIVIGQPDFTSGSGATGPTRLKNPSALAFDAQDNLWVSDTGNNRILKFSFPFPQTNAAADYVIGQINFTNNNSGPGGSPNSLSSPQGIAFDSAGALWVVDAGRHRVLRFDNNFPVNPSASLVLGQSNLWTGSLTGAQANTLPYPGNMTFDSKGSLWVLDTGDDRLLRFDAPFQTGMSAALVIGKNDLNSQMPPNADLARLNSPRGVGFDPHGNLYVSDDRLLKFNPPFSNGMSASVVVGAGGEDVLAFTHKDSEPIPILWVVSGSKISGYKPNQSAFSDITLTSMKVSWQSLPGFPLTNYLVELSPKPDFSDLKASPWIQDLSYTFSGLIYGTAYYARVKMKYPDGTESEYLNLGKQSTLPPITVTGVTNGITEVQFSAVNPLINISPLYPNWDTGVVALRSAVDMGLTQISSVFVIGPDGAYVPPATLTFYYTESQIGWYGLTKDDIAVYEFFGATGLWVELPDKVIDPINHSITVPVHNVASLFGIFGKVRDRQAPVTKLNLTGSAYQTGEVTYISGRSSITLSAYDPVAYDTSTGVAFTEYRVDAATATSPFTSYVSPFTLSVGQRLIEFRSQDHAGNLEVVKSSIIYVDAAAPITGVALSGDLGRNGWYLSGVTSVLTSTDTSSGISEILYALNGAAFVNYQQPIVIPLDGNHRLDFYARDNVGNTELVKTSTFSIDRTAPQVGHTLNPQPNLNGWNNSSVEAIFNATDILSGTDICTSSRTNVEGLNRTLSGWCRDIAGNISYSTVVVNIDISSPVVNVIASPVANSSNWNNTSVTVAFIGSDAISDIFTCFGDKTVSSEGAVQIVTGSCADKAGNSRSAFRVVNIDKTSPVTTVSLTGTLVSGWYNTAVSIMLTPTDVLSGVNQTNYRLERSGVLISSGVYASSVAVSVDGLYTVYYYATDKAGNAEGEKSIDFKIDRALPQVNYTLLPAANGSAWNNTAVQVVFSGTDTLSGVVQCSSQTVSAAGQAQTVAGWCRDAAGNTGYATATVNVDLAAPVVLSAQAPAKNNYGWNSTLVTATFAGSDALSGIAYCTPAATISNEGSSQTVTGYCRDYAGLSSTATLAISIDKTAPLISAVRTPLANLYGWANQDVSVNYTCSDNLSGVRTCPPVMLFSSEGVNSSTSAMVYDYAGSTNQVTVNGLNIDKTKPVTTAALSGTLVNAWYNTAVSITLGSTDSLSGVERMNYRLERAGVLVSSGVYTVPVSASADGQYTVYYYSTDKAGNAEAEKSTAFKIDRTLPQVSYTLLPAANGSAWNNTAVQVVFSGTDTLSGVVECSSKTISTEGQAQAVAGWCRDTAGNIGNFTATVNVDLTKPVSIATQNPAPNLKGWNNNNVGVTFSGSDILSGLSYCSPGKIISAEGAAQLVSGYCMDYSGNTSTAALVLNIDKTAPGIFISSPAAGSYSVATKNKIIVSFAVTDNLDPAPKAAAMLRQVEDRGSPRGVRPAAIVVVDGQQIEPLDIDDGIWRLTANATDFADNIGSAAGGLFEVVHDVLPPRTALTAGAGSYQGSGQALYVTGRTTFTLTSIDDLVAVADGVGLGVKKQGIGVNAEGRGLLRGLAFENTAPVQGAAYISTFKLNQEIDGAYSLAFNSEDVLANVEKIKVSTFIVDNTPPQTTFSRVSGPAYLTYVSTWTLFELAPADPGAFVSGVKETAYSINSGAVATSPLKFTLPGADGSYLVKYRSRDNLENLEVEKSSQVFVDATPPLSALSVIGGKQYPGAEPGSFYASFASKFGFAAADPVVGGGASGVNAIMNADNGVPHGTYTQPISLDEGKHAITYRATDRVENTEIIRSTHIYIDNTVPVTSFNISEPLYIKDGVRYITPVNALAFSAIDPLTKEVAAGVERIETAVDGGQWTKYTQALKFGEGRHTIKYRAIDNVGNMEAERVIEVQSDNTAPVTLFDIAGPLYLKDGIRHITPESGLAFSSVDPLVSEVSAGVERIETAVDGGQWLKYTQALKFTEGRHTIKYRAIDNVGNMEAERVLEVRSDATPPVTAQHIGAPYYVSGVGVNYITPDTPLTFSANDPVTSDVASGVERIETAVDGAAYALYTAALKFPEGRHTIKYRAWDNVGNLEAAQTLEVQSDASAPESRWLAATGPWIEKNNKFYLNALGSIALESSDPVRNNVAAGLENIYYGIDAAPAVKYSAAFSLAEGVRTVNYSAKDNLGNTELVKSTVVYVDGTKPVTSLSLSGDQYSGDKQYVSQRTDIIITTADPAVNNVAVGVKDTRYSVDGGAFVDYSLFKLSAEGKRLVSYYSTDYVSNIEMAKTTALWVDNTPPSTELSIAGALYTTPGDEKLYITRDSGIVLTSSDPVSNDTASGVMLTKYRIDGGNWLVYSGSFTIAAEGLHTLEYYALDRVQNAEVLKSAKIAVDNTPPVTGISLGEPKSEVFGLPVIMQNTPITLTAADPVMSGVSSGLNSIFYEIENVQTGVRAPVAAYTSPFTIAEQGTFIIRYWSKDNTGNTETPKEKMAAVTTWRADGLIAASGLDMSGTADISGSVKSNAIVSLGGNARILGDVTASTITLTGKAQITGLQINGTASVNPAPIYLAGIVQNAAAVNNNALVSAYLVDGKLALSSKVNLTLSTGTYYFKGMDLSGGSSITISGKVDILVEGDITINGGSSMNADGEASRLSILVSTSSELKFNGGGALAACVYAPYSDLKLTGNALLGGHYFVKTAAVSGTGNLLQSGEALPVAAAPAGGGPKTKAAAMPGSRVGVLAGPDPEFRLGEVYVFPNPAKGTESPVFHIETGIADSVKITIYTISGRMAHEQTLAGLPAELDDGNGLSYAYEYTWRGHIPSGIYLYSIEAQKSGQKLKKTGKFGVVR